MRKKEMLERWQGIERDRALAPAAVPYKHKGSTYDQDGIRITGSQAWIDSVLSRLADLLKFENGSTRLQVVYKRSTDRHTGAEIDGFNCYVQVHERGSEAQMMHAVFQGAVERTGGQYDYRAR